VPAGSFTTDITAIRERARQKMEEGAVTGSYGMKPDPTTRRLLEGTLADEEEHADDLVDLIGA
jgi:bacterioferritin (cytochrome b1)